MIDQRFYETFGPLSVRALAPDCEIGGDANVKVSGVASAKDAGPDDLCYYDAKGGAALESAPGACVLQPAAAHLAPKARALILAEHPRTMFARIAAKLARPRWFEGEQHVHPSAQLEEDVILAPGVVIGPGAHIGAGSRIGPGAAIGPGVAIGRRALIGANVSISFSLIGDDAKILAGAVIGETGFGVAGDALGLVDVPHLGRVILQDRVTIGANSTIDRGVFGDTVIGEDSKIDNLSQIGHNCEIGRGVLIAAFGGISGSTVVGDYVAMGGRVGIADHRVIGARARLAAGSGVLQDIPAGETWAGYPAKPRFKWLRETAWLSRKATGARTHRDDTK